jgi:hypothetical protein
MSRSVYAWAGAALVVTAAQPAQTVDWSRAPLPLAAALTVALLAPAERSCLLQGASHALTIDILLLTPWSEV